MKVADFRDWWKGQTMENGTDGIGHCTDYDVSLSEARSHCKVSRDVAKAGLYFRETILDACEEQTSDEQGWKWSVHLGFISRLEPALGLQASYLCPRYCLPFFGADSLSVNKFCFKICCVRKILPRLPFLNSFQCHTL